MHWYIYIYISASRNKKRKKKKTKKLKELYIINQNLPINSKNITSQNKWFDASGEVIYINSQKEISDFNHDLLFSSCNGPIVLFLIFMSWL